MNPLQPAKSISPPVKQFIKECLAMGVPRETAKAEYNKHKNQECWMNDLYVVLVIRDEQHGFGDDIKMDYLSIRRVDREPVRNWRHIQEIKNQLVGPECEGFEMYPAESRVADCANQYHVYVFTDPEARIPIGMQTGMKSTDSLCGSHNEPFDEKTGPSKASGRDNSS